jgi:hypothetical protein
MEAKMGRWNEIKYTLGFNILFPRFCLFVFIPCSLLLAGPSPPQFPLLVAVLYPAYAKVVLACSLLLFGLSVAANLSISRYLRRHQTQGSPYTYNADWDDGSRSSYFRIQVTDKEAFRRLLREIQREHPKEAIRFWLLADSLVFVPPVLLLGLFALVFMLLPWLVQYLWERLTKRKPKPAAQG